MYRLAPLALALVVLTAAPAWSVEAAALAQTSGPTAGPTTSPTPPPGDPDCFANRTDPTPGETLLVNGRNWRPGSVARLFFRQDRRSQFIADTFVNGAGRFGTSAQIPHSAHPGPAQIRVRGQDENGEPKRCVIRLNVIPGGQSAGFESAPATRATVAVVLSTIAVIWVGRRRRMRELTG